MNPTKEESPPPSEGLSESSAVRPPAPPTNEQDTSPRNGGKAFGLLRRWQIGIRLTEYPANWRAVAWALSTRMGSDGTAKRDPAQESLASDAGVAKRTVQRATSALVADGWLKRSGGRFRGDIFHYRLTIPAAYEERIERVLGGGRRVTQTTRKGDSADVRRVTVGPPSIALAMLSGGRANACAFCAATASPGGWSFTHHGKVCAHHNTSDRAYAWWAAIGDG